MKQQYDRGFVIGKGVLGMGAKKARMFNISKIEEVLQEFFSARCQNRLGMKLNTLDRQVFVTDAHYQSISSGRGDLQIIWKGFRLDR